MLKKLNYAMLACLPAVLGLLTPVVAQFEFNPADKFSTEDKDQFSVEALEAGDFGDSGGFSDSRDRVKVTVKANRTSVPPGSEAVIAVIFDHDPKWHIYAHDAQLEEGFFKTQIEAESSQPQIATVHDAFIQWPQKHEIDFLGSPVEVYEGRAIAYVPVTTAADAQPGQTVTLTIRPSFQACDDRLCLMPTPYPPAHGLTSEEDWRAYGHKIKLKIVELAESSAGDVGEDFAGFQSAAFSDIRAGAKPPDLVDFDLFGWQFSINAAGTTGFVLLLLIAALGGMLLNCTPCVLPMVPIKIMGLSHAASGHRLRTFILGLAMAAGIIGFWLALGVLIAGASGFTSTNQLFQYPAFTITVGAVIVIMAIGMCGLFSIKLPQAVYLINPKHETLHGSLFFGVMAAVLSTPCTAPFMGAAAAFAATQSASFTLSVFAAIGAGMALPYVLLAAFPQIARKMPRTGPASELIKQVMGLLMLAAGAYFVGVGLSGLMVTPPDPPSKLYWWVVAALGIAAGAWLALRTFQITKNHSPRAWFGGIGALIVAISLYIGVRMSSPGPIDWMYYTPQRFAEAKSSGDVVVMEFTAEWCLNCKALEDRVLHTEAVSQVLNAAGVTPIKVDLTGNNHVGNEMLNSLNRLTIPLLVVFAADGTEVFKGDFYTVDQVLNAVEEAKAIQIARQ